MAMNKSGKTEAMTWLIILGIVAVVYIANVGGIKDTVNGFFQPTQVVINQGSGSGNAPVLTDTKDCPTSGTTTYTINVLDELATTATSVYPDYYIFNGNQLIKEGSLTSSANTVDLSCGKDYKLLLVNTTTTSGFYPKVIDLKARIAQQTVNEKLVKFGNAKIYGIQNPSDPSRLSNISLVASATKSFEIKFGANKTEQGYNRPLILCTVNVSSIQSVNIDRFDDGSKPVVSTVPKRTTSSSGYIYYAWEYPKMLTPTMGTVTASGSITATSTTPALEDTLTCKLADQTAWKTASYKTATSIEEAFKTGAENSETQTDVGAPDSSTAAMYFSNGGGY